MFLRPYLYAAKVSETKIPLDYLGEIVYIPFTVANVGCIQIDMCVGAQPLKLWGDFNISYFINVFM